jgi:hypothetical protein
VVWIRWVFLLHVPGLIADPRAGPLELILDVRRRALQTLRMVAVPRRGVPREKGDMPPQAGSVGPRPTSVRNGSKRGLLQEERSTTEEERQANDGAPEDSACAAPCPARAHLPVHPPSYVRRGNCRPETNPAPTGFAPEGLWHVAQGFIPGLGGRGRSLLPGLKPGATGRDPSGVRNLTNGLTHISHQKTHPSPGPSLRHRHARAPKSGRSGRCPFSGLL